MAKPNDWYVLVTIAPNGVKHAWGPCTRAEARRRKAQFDRDEGWSESKSQYMILKMLWDFDPQTGDPSMSASLTAYGYQEPS